MVSFWNIVYGDFPRDDRLPGVFMFRLTTAKEAEVVADCDHLTKLRFSRVLPFAFTEHDAIQAPTVLASPQAVEMGIFRAAGQRHDRLADG